MSAYKLEQMKEIYFGFSGDFKLALSLVRIYSHTELDKVDKSHKKGLVKEISLATKHKNKLRSSETKSLKSKEKACFKKSLEDFGYEVDILAYDLENADNQIEMVKDEINLLKSELDGKKGSKRKVVTKQLDKLKAKVLMLSIAREKIKFYYDSISNNSKFGYKAIKIRRIYEKQTRAKVASLDKRIAQQTKILNTAPKAKKEKKSKNTESFA